MLLLGGLTGWYIYLARKVDPKELVEKSSVLKGLHTFLWNRWYINALYYRVFVDGTLKLKQVIFQNFELKVIDRIDGAVSGTFTVFSQTLFKFLETGVVDRLFKQGVPALFTGIYDRVKRIQTGVLSYNLFYVVVVLMLLLLGVLIGGR